MPTDPSKNRRNISESVFILGLKAPSQQQITLNMIQAKISSSPLPSSQIKNLTEESCVKLEEPISKTASYLQLKEVKKNPQKITQSVYRLCSEKGVHPEDKEAIGRKSNCRKGKNCDDDEYRVKTQKKDRNVTSNIVHHLFKYMSFNSEMTELIKKIIAAKNLSITAEEFKQMVKIDSQNLKTYVTGKHIKQLWFSPNVSRRQYCKIMRILSRYFFKQHGFVSIFASNKFNQLSKKNHYGGLRLMLDTLNKKKIQQIQ